MVPCSMPRWFYVPGAVLAVLVGGCTSDAPENDGAAGSLSGDVSCAADPRVDAFRQGMSKTGERGVLSFQLLTSEPAPPAKGDNAFELRITDENDEPVDVALTVELSMPDHGHGSPVAPKIGFEDEKFRVAPLDLFMAGVWQIDLFAASGDDATPVDAARFFFCIEG